MLLESVLGQVVALLGPGELQECELQLLLGLLVMLLD
jgi:hypothetical protein